ncbi:hypothetical protein EYF80_017226 [Liparis tanakae]|uniref:Uncharacterized protein n=1 Tax=Liparis tanakae TaxID=230148 RepID=A0A4Z2I3H2_9TELE|nr:hypothetical protein EYF80_017226 [Liparis tanakae]
MQPQSGPSLEAELKQDERNNTKIKLTAAPSQQPDPTSSTSMHHVTDHSVSGLGSGSASLGAGGDLFPPWSRSGSCCGCRCPGPSKHHCSSYE